MPSSKGIYRILLADDEPTIRSLVQERLKAQRHVVRACENGSEVLDLLDSETFSLLILDAMMPGPSFVELARSIRGRGIAVPILIMSELNTEHVLQACEGLESVSAIAKPFTLRAFSLALKEAMARVES